MRMRFTSTLLQSGKTATGLVVPNEVVEALGAGKKPAVRVTINGHAYRSSIASMGGVFMLGVSAENRALAGVQAGDDLDVDVELDTLPREVDVPTDLAAALTANTGAKAFFEGLSYSNRRRLVLAVEAAKAADTRARRIQKTVEMLAEGRAQ
jgi:hypothetical protein